MIKTMRQMVQDFLLMAATVFLCVGSVGCGKADAPIASFDERVAVSPVDDVMFRHPGSYLTIEAGLADGAKSADPSVSIHYEVTNAYFVNREENGTIEVAPSELPMRFTALEAVGPAQGVTMSANSSAKPMIFTLNAWAEKELEDGTVLQGPRISRRYCLRD